MEYLCIFILTVVFLSANGVNGNEKNIKLELFDFYKNYNSESRIKEKYYTFDELISRSLEFGLDCQEKTQVLFQAYKAVKIKRANLLPQINLISIGDSVIERSMSLETFLPFVGFLFPSRWYDWKAAKHLRDAEEYSLAAIFADKAQTVQNLYLNVELQLWSIRVLEFYIDELDRVINVLIQQKKSGKRTITSEDIAILQNIKGKLSYDLAFTDSLSASLPQLATALGNKPEYDWAHLQVEPHKLESVEKFRPREYSEFWEIALEKSPEIKNIQSLILASRNDRKRFYFDFLDPDAGNNLGFGYGSTIKVSRSNTGILQIQLERSKMRLSNAIQDALNNYNDSVNSFPGIILALRGLEKIRFSVEKHINDEHIPFDINKIIRHFDYAVGQALRYISSYFVLRSAEANLNRYVWRGKVYGIVDDYVSNKVPELLVQLKRMYSNKRRFINKLTRRYEAPKLLTRDTSSEFPKNAHNNDI